MNKNKILILGATGMLGRAIYNYLSEVFGKNTSGTSRSKKNKKFLYFNFKKERDVDELFQNRKYRLAINCIGTLKGASDKDLNLLNHVLPSEIEKISKKYGFKVIHISTDAVFSNNAGIVYEDSKTNPSNQYGKTKLAGEIKSGINIRTSILGFDPAEHKGLLEHVLKNKAGRIKGFTNQKWSGATVLQLAQFIEWILAKNNFENLLRKTNVVHFAPLGPTTKYEIIETLSKLISGPKVSKGTGSKITRHLKSRYIEEIKLKRYTRDLKNALSELIEFDKSYVKSQ